MNNTFGTHVLLEASRKWGKIKRFINVSTVRPCPPPRLSTTCVPTSLAALAPRRFGSPPNDGPACCGRCLC